MTSPVRSTLRLAAAGCVALLVGLLDQPLFDVQVHWVICVLIGLVLMYVGVFICFVTTAINQQT